MENENYQREVNSKNTKCSKFVCGINLLAFILGLVLPVTAIA
jgi:hypothetical protein